MRTTFCKINKNSEDSTRNFPIWNTTKKTYDMNKYEFKNVINNKNLEQSSKLHGE